MPHPSRLVSTAIVATMGVLLAAGCQGDGPVPTASDVDQATSPALDTPTQSPSPSPSPTDAEVPDPYAVHGDADALAGVLVDAEVALRAGLDPEEHAAWAWVQQAAYRQWVDHPEWNDAVRARVAALSDSRIAPAVEANLLAGRELRALTKPRDELPPWRIIDPPSVEVLRDAYESAAAEFGIDWTHLAAIHLTETRMGRIEGDSTAGARGPMQFLPSTWDAWGEGDIMDPHDAIRAAARYLAGHGAPGDLDGALWAYNHSDRYVAAVKAYASVLQAEPDQYRTYHGWQVYYRLVSGDEVLEVGWSGRNQGP